MVEARPRADADCPICLSKVDAPGETWHQLEPCRHWVCGGCGEAWMQEHARNSCPQCRETIAIYVRARSGV